MLEAFRKRLLDVRSDNIKRFGRNRSGIIENEAEQACALASELGILKSPGLTWQEFQTSAPDLHYGTEHAVELSASHGRVVKITIPPRFGLAPQIVSHPVVDLRREKSEPLVRHSIEFLPATPSEYLTRWIAANEIFGDHVELHSVVKWDDGNVSFVVSQPQYHGEPAPVREIDRFFESAGWTRLRDESGHTLYFNYAFQVLAIDALPRNCYLHQDSLLPFDVILCHPDEELEKFLKLYPGLHGS